MSARLAFTGVDGSRQVVVDRPLILGRGLECDLHFDDARLSRRHARIVPAGSGVEVLDLGSRNGTFVNGQVVKAARLINGDVLQVGHMKLCCQAVPDLPPPVVSERPRRIPDTQEAPEASATRLLPPAPARRAPGVPARGDKADARSRQPRSRFVDVARALLAAVRREPVRFGSPERFTRGWRRQVVTLWMLAAIALLAVPGAWLTAAISRHSDEQAELAARWLAAAAGGAADGSALDELGARVARAAGLESVTFLDDHCLIVSPTSKVRGRDARVDCAANGQFEALGSYEGALAINVARVANPGESRAVMVVTRSGARIAHAGPFWLTEAACLLMVSLTLWIVSGRLCGRMVAVVDEFAERASAVARDGGRVGTGHPVPALDRIAGIIDLLLVRGEPHIPAPVQGESAPHVPAAPDPPTCQTMATRPTRRAMPRVSLFVNADFSVERVVGDGEWFGLVLGDGARHILDVLQGDAALTNAVLGLLAAPGRAASPVMICATSGGDRIRVELSTAEARFEIRLTREDAAHES